MKRFVFPLQFMVEANQRTERDLQIELARLRNHHEELAKAELELLERIEKARQNWQERLMAGSGGRILMHYNQIFTLLRRELAEQQWAVRVAEQQVDQCQDRLHEVLRDLEALTLLRQAQQAQHDLAVQQEKDREMDEFVACHHKKGELA